MKTYLWSIHEELYLWMMHEYLSLVTTWRHNYLWLLLLPCVRYSGDRWVSGEDEESIAQKIEYLKRKSIGGVALFSQSEDDFSGKFCNRGKFPLSFKVFEDSNINSNRRLLLPWQRYCSGQSPLRVKARWCLGLHTVVTMVVVLWGCMPW